MLIPNQRTTVGRSHSNLPELFCEGMAKANSTSQTLFHVFGFLALEYILVLVGMSEKEFLVWLILCIPPFGAMASKPMKEIGAAMVAATAVPTALNWTDVIKTRMQGMPAPGCTAAPYNGGFLGTAQRILAEEGVKY